MIIPQALQVGTFVILTRILLEIYDIGYLPTQAESSRTVQLWLRPTRQRANATIPARKYWHDYSRPVKI